MAEINKGAAALKRGTVTTVNINFMHVVDYHSYNDIIIKAQSQIVEL